MEKSLNLRIYEEVLQYKFPNEFAYNNSTLLGPIFSTTEYFDFEKKLIDVFWLAEKLGLFSYCSLTYSNYSDEWVIYHKTKPLISFSSENIPEVICKAILEIYKQQDDK